MFIPKSKLSYFVTCSKQSKLKFIFRFNSEMGPVKTNSYMNFHMGYRANPTPGNLKEKFTIYLLLYCLPYIHSEGLIYLEAPK